MPVQGPQTASATSPANRGRGFSIAQRVLLAVVGGYALSAGIVAIGAQALASAMPRSEAVVLMAMLGFLVYLTLLLWAFAERRSARLWGVLGGGSVAVWVLVRTLPVMRSH